MLACDSEARQSVQAHCNISCHMLWNYWYGDQHRAVAGDISVERLAEPPVIIPTGAFWAGLEDFWSDLVNELPDIPNGGNQYFLTQLKPSLGQHCALGMQTSVFV